MRPGPAPELVESTDATVTIDGQAAPATSWSVTRSLGQLGRPAIRAATGGASLARDEAIASRRHGSPWRGTVPRPRQEVTIDAGAGPWRVFSGVVDSVEGRAGSGVDVDFVDRLNALNQPISLPGLLRAMPPDESPGDFRHIGLQAEYVADYAMRRCGFYATPWRTVDTVLDAPLQTSCWPHIGHCRTATTNTSSDFSQGTYRPTPTGFFGSENLYAVYRATAEVSPNGPLHIMASVGSTHTGNGRVWMVFTGGNIVLEATATHVRARVAGTNVVNLPAPAGSYTTFGLSIRGGTIRLETNGGHSGTGAMPSGLSGTSREVRVSSDPGSRLAGVQVGTPADATYDLYPVRQWTQSAVLRNWNNIIYLDATPDVSQRPAIEVLTEIARAQCIYLWLDEDGVLHFEHADAIRSRAPVTTLTATDSLLDLVHSQGSDETGVNINVAAVTPVINRSPSTNIVLWQGRTSGMDNDQVLEEVINNGQEVWVEVDTSFSAPYVPGGGGEVTENTAKGRSSLTGGIITEDNQPDILVGGGTNAKATLANPTPGVWSLRIEAGPLTATQNLSLKLADLPIVPSSYRGMNLPVVRGKGKAEWAPATATAPTNEPGRDAITHDGGHWLQQSGAGANGPQVIADWLGSVMGGPDRTSVTINVIPDFRVQLADVVRITDPVWTGVSLTGVVADITMTGSNGSQTMRLGLDITSATPTDVTLGEYDQRWSGDTLGDRDEHWSGDTLADFDANPLG